MANRLFLGIDRMPLVGGILCLDFVNTTGARASGAARERLGSYRDLLTWCRRAEVLTVGQERAFAKEADNQPVNAGGALEEAIAIRETIYRLLGPLANGDPLPCAELDSLNDLMREAAGHRRIREARGSVQWEWSISPNDLRCVTWPIVQSAGDLLVSDDLQCLKQCDECDWLFLDTSKNKSRRFCKKTCGDRVKSRRYYQRHRKDE